MCPKERQSPPPNNIKDGVVLKSEKMYYSSEKSKITNRKFKIQPKKIQNQ